MESPQAGALQVLAAFKVPPQTHIALAPQVDGKKYPSSEDGIQVVVIDGSQGHVVSHMSFRNSILQGIPWQLFNYVSAVPDK